MRKKEKERAATLEIRSKCRLGHDSRTCDAPDGAGQQCYQDKVLGVECGQPGSKVLAGDVCGCVYVRNASRPRPMEEETCSLPAVLKVG